MDRGGQKLIPQSKKKGGHGYIFLGGSNRLEMGESIRAGKFDAGGGQNKLLSNKEVGTKVLFLSRKRYNSVRISFGGTIFCSRRNDGTS